MHTSTLLIVLHVLSLARIEKICTIFSFIQKLILTCHCIAEVCQRIDTAVPSIRHNMFSYLSPWLLNIELVNPQIPTTGTFLPPTPKCVADTLSYNSGGGVSAGADGRSQTGLQGYGWGSCQASEMVLNNMMYLTVRVGKCIHIAEIE